MASADHPRRGSETFRQLLRDRGEVVAARGREAGFYRHMPTRGVAREHILREPLVEILPERYGVTSGEVHASDGSVSGQWDVLIYNRRDTPRFFLSDAAAVLPVEGILAAISVKSTLGQDAMNEVAEAAATLREMPRESLPTAPQSRGLLPAVFAFGFQGVELSTLRKHTLDACESPESNRRITAACVLGTGLVLPVDAAGNVAPDDIASYRVAHARTGSWGIFVGVLLTALIYQAYAAPHVLKYIALEHLLDEED